MDYFPKVAVILAGGQGQRLWPLSTGRVPKPLINLSENGTLLQQAVARGSTWSDSPIVVVAHEEAAESVAAQLDVKEHFLLLEPLRKNTAVAAAMAAWHIWEEWGDALMLILPADHRIEHEALLKEVLQAGEASALAGNIVLFGITPAVADSGLGYLVPALGALPWLVTRFVEKPPLEHAISLMSEGALCNSGIFLLRASVLLVELRRHYPEIYNMVQKAHAQRQVLKNMTRFLPEVYDAIVQKSLDHAIMEHSERLRVIPIDHVGWADMGSWQQMWKHTDKDAAGNAVRGVAEARDSNNCFIMNVGDRPIICEGVDDLVIVQTKDAVLVRKRER